MRKIIKKSSIFILLTATFLSTGCKKDNQIQNGNGATGGYYFPPVTGNEWESVSAQTLGWDTTKLNEAFSYAGTKNTYGLIVLKNGRIVKEQYWNNWNQNTRYYLASAGKSVVAFLFGIAQQDGLIGINDKTSQYLGEGWTTLPSAKENLITIKNQLTMTSGLDDAVPDDNCTDSACLIYKADAGSRWAYHNAPYLLLHDVLTEASGQPINVYSRNKLFDKIGMSQSLWFNNVLYSTTREAARFGSLILQKGIWNNDTLLRDRSYFDAMTQSSQTINPSYGYLWWLNGKNKFMVPTLQTVFFSSLVPEGPADMIMALGKEDKKIYVIPSLGIVAVRLGDAAETVTLGPSSFDNEFWRRMRQAIGY